MCSINAHKPLDSSLIIIVVVVVIVGFVSTSTKLMTCTHYSCSKFEVVL